MSTIEGFIIYAVGMILLTILLYYLMLDGSPNRIEKLLAIKYNQYKKIGEEEKAAIENAICYLEDSEFPSDEEYDIKILRKLLEED
jgi:hypothetical protein